MESKWYIQFMKKIDCLMKMSVKYYKKRDKKLELVKFLVNNNLIEGLKILLTWTHFLI